LKEKGSSCREKKSCPECGLMAVHLPRHLQIQHKKGRQEAVIQASRAKSEQELSAIEMKINLNMCGHT
jgi:hypothetical protein